MARFFLRRAAFALLLVVVASSSALVLTRLAPGDVTADLGPLARPDEVRAVRAQLDLDRSIGAQWALWAGRVLRADFGRSYLYNQPVRGLVARAAVEHGGAGRVRVAGSDAGRGGPWRGDGPRAAERRG